jgi:hypothetical protein
LPSKSKETEEVLKTESKVDEVEEMEIEDPEACDVVRGVLSAQDKAVYFGNREDFEEEQDEVLNEETSTKPNYDEFPADETHTRERGHQRHRKGGRRRG